MTLLTVPWELILKQAPALISAAADLLMRSRGRPAQLITAKDLDALRERCAELARDQQAHAELLKRLTDQLGAVTEAAQINALRARRATIVAAAGVALSVVACALALLR
jgi:hypothetical protein